MRIHRLSFPALVTLSSAVLAPACSSSSSPAGNDMADASGGSDATPTADGATTGNDASTGDASDAAGCTASQFEWATSGGGPGQGDGVNGVATDGDGNVWLTGTFIGAATWGTFQLSAADTVHTTGFVAKLDPGGHVLLARALEGGTGGVANATVFGSRIRVDKNGDAYVAGGYEKQLDVDGVHLLETNTGNGSAFLLKLDHATGAAVWGVTSSSGGDGESATDLAVDANGDVYVVGQYNGGVTFGSLTLTAESSDEAVFVAKYSPSANDFVWAKGWAGQVVSTNDGGVGRGVAVSADGSVYVTGTVSGTMSVDGTILTNDQGSFLAKLGAADGHLVWVTTMSPAARSSPVVANAVAVDATGDAYLTGTFSGTPSFEVALAGEAGTVDAGTVDAAAPDAGGGAISVQTTGGGDDMFLAKYGANGAPLWATHAGAQTPLAARGDDVAFDGASVFVSGFSQGPTVFGGITLSTSTPFFVAKYDASGAPVWAQGTSSTGNANGEGQALSVPSPTAGVVVGGSYAGPTTAGASTLPGTDADDAFVARLCN